MPWLDQVLAAPTLGILCDPWLLMPMKAWPALAKVTRTWPTVAVGNINDSPWHHVAERGDGLAVELDLANIICKFVYKMQVGTEGAFPSFKAPEVRPFSDVLGAVRTASKDTVNELELNPKVQRIGIMADCNIALHELPPGAASFIERVRRLGGGGELDAVAANFTVVLERRRSDFDRCHYSVEVASFSEAPRVRLKIDWQRVWPSGLSMTAASLNTMVGACADAATKHFEAFGAGEMEAGDGRD